MHHYLQSVADTQDLEIRTMPRITYICRQGHRSVRFLVSSLQFLIPAPLLILISYTELCSLLTFPTMCKVIANCCCAQLHPHPPLSLSLCLSTCLSGHKAGTCPRPLQRYTDMSMCPPFITVCFVSFMFCGRPLHIMPNSFWYFAIPALLCKLLFYLTKSIITSATKEGRVAGGKRMSRTTHALTTSNKSKLQNYKIAIRSEVLWVKYCSSYENRECTQT